MENKLTFNELKPSLVSLGFAFYGKAKEVADPELTIVNAIKLLPTEAKLFRMLLAWLEKTRELIHVERIRTLSEELSQGEFIYLGVLALKQVNAGDRRFSILVDFSKKKLEQNKGLSKSLFSEAQDAYLISKYGVDEELLEFGIKAAKISAADEKKILSLPGILKQNSWLKFRVLIGANFRADLAYVMAYKLAHNAYQAAKIVGCSQETAYRLWKGLILYPHIELLVR